MCRQGRERLRLKIFSQVIIIDQQKPPSLINREQHGAIGAIMKVRPFPYSALVVDDSPHMRILLMRMLQKNGISSIESAVNGAEGVERYKSSKPDVVFLDAIMPEKDGLTALREIKGLDPAAIVIMTTSLSEREKVLQFKDAGANYYLLKPFEEEKFIDTLGKVIAILAQRGKKE